MACANHYNTSNVNGRAHERVHDYGSSYCILPPTRKIYMCIYIFIYFLITEGVFSALVVKLNINLL